MSEQRPSGEQHHWQEAGHDPHPPPVPPEYGQPAHGDPAAGYGAPGYGAPGYGAPGYGAPGYGAPGYGDPAAGYPQAGYPQAGPDAHAAGYAVPAGHPVGPQPAFAAVPGYGYPFPTEHLVPRPPRPGSVRTAVLLTWIGIVVSGVATIVGAVFTWRYRDVVLEGALAGEDLPPTADLDTVLGITTAVTLGITVLVWLAVAVAMAIFAELTRRGRNGARITLAVLAGVIGGLQLLCSPLALVAESSMSGLAGTTSTLDAGPPALQTWNYVSIAINVALGAVAVVILVLALVRSAREYTSPGPGRQFLPGT